MLRAVLFVFVLFAGALPCLAANPVNDVCPIKGNEVDKESPTREFKGYTIGFCCPGCEGKWDALPEADKLAFLVKYVPDAGHANAQAAALPAEPATPALSLARAYIAACDAADAKALDALFLDKSRATILENASDEGSWEVYRDHHLLPELAEMKEITFTLATENEQVFGATSVVTQTGSFAIPDPNHPDTPRTILSAVTYVIVDENGSPKIAHLHWSSRAQK